MYRSQKFSVQSLFIGLAMLFIFMMAFPTGAMLAADTDPTPVATKTATAEPGTVPTRTPSPTDTAEPGNKFVAGKVVLVASDLDNTRVSDELDRIPVSAALVTAYRIDKRERASTTTNDSGEYVLELGPGLWAISVQPTDESDPMDWVYAREAQEVKFDRSTDDERQEVNFVVIPTSGSVSGNITLPDGSAPDFPVEIGVRNGEGVGRQFITEAGDGSFEIALPPGRFDLLIHPKSDSYVGPNLEPFLLRPGQDLDLGDIALLELTASVSGTVLAVDLDGNGETDESVGIPDIPVVAWSRGKTAVVRTQTDENGNYTLNLSQGKWHIQPAPGPKTPFIYLGDGRTVRLEAEDNLTDINFRVIPANGTIKGTVIINGTDEVATEVEGWAIAGNPDRPDLLVGAPIRNGEFKMFVPRGAYSVTVEFAPGSPYSLVARANAEVGAGETATVEIPVKKRTEKIIGALYDPRDNNSVVTGVRGKVGGWMDDRWSATHIDPATGRYSLNVSEGIWQIDYKIDPEAYVKLQGAQNVPVPVDQTVELPLPITQKDAGISGQVLAPDGSPLAGAIVIFDGISSEIAPLWLHTRTDESGNYRFALPHGRYNVGAVGGERNWINPVDLTIEVEPNQVAEGVNLQFIEPNATLIGRLEVPEAPEDGNVLVFAWTERGGFEWASAEVIVNDEGSAVGDYELRLAGDAIWNIMAAYESGDSFWRVTDEVKIEEGVTTTLNLSLEGPMIKPAPVVVTFDADEAQRIELGDGTSIFIPAGAMPVEGEVTLRIDPIATLPFQRNAKVIGYGYAIHATDADGRPIEETFNHNVLIQFPFDRDDFRGSARKLKPAYFSTTTNRWTAPERFAVDLESRTVKMAIDHFTDFAILEGEAETVFLPILTR